MQRLTYRIIALTLHAGERLFRAMIGTVLVDQVAYCFQSAKVFVDFRSQCRQISS